MYKHESLEYENVITSFPFVPQEMCPNKREGRDEQNYYYTQIPFDIEVADGLFMDYHIVVFFNLDKMIIPKEQGYEKITK